MEINEDSIVKIGRKGERIWVQITERNGDFIEGKIACHPVNKEIGKYGDTIQFFLEEIDKVYVEKKGW